MSVVQPNVGQSGSPAQDLRLLELGHRFNNDLQAISNLAERELLRCTDAGASAALGRVIHQVTAVSILYRHLRATSSASVDFVEYLSELCEKISDTISPEVCTVRLAIDLTPLHLRVERASRLAIVVNELVTNAAQHAFPSGRPGTVTVRLHQIASGHVALLVSDNGSGVWAARPGRRGLGLVEELVSASGGVLMHRRGCGTTWTITFPQDG